MQSNLFSQNWETLADMPVGLAFPVVVALNGEIHVIGGGGPAGATDIHLRYKPLTNIWDTLAPVPYLAQQPSGAVLNGKIHYFGGGFPNSGTPLSSHYVYDPGTNSWTIAASLPIARVIMESAVINGKIYALGGQPNKSRVDEYNPTTNSWTTKNALPDNNFWYSEIAVLNNEIYRFGGGGYSAPSNSVHKYDSVSDSWTNIATLPVALHAPAGSALGGLIYIAGGYNTIDLDVVRTFNTNTSTFNTITPLPSARSYHDIVTVDTCIYSIGGNNPSFPNMNTSLIRYCNSSGVSVKEILSPKTIVVFPNPANDYITFENINSPVMNAELFDLMGAKKMEMTINKGTKRVDISELPEGIYFYRLSCDNNEKTFVGKIIVVR